MVRDIVADCWGYLNDSFCDGLKLGLLITRVLISIPMHCGSWAIRYALLLGSGFFQQASPVRNPCVRHSSITAIISERVQFTYSRVEKQH